MKIALGHQARVGKDTFAEYVGGERLSFAAKLYEVCESIQTILNKPVQKDAELLQKVGVLMREHYGQNIWADIVMEQIKEMSPDQTIIVTDMRFPNEMKLLKEAGFTTIKIVRPGRVIDRNPNHISEVALASAHFDHVIINDGSLDDYRKKIDALIPNNKSGGFSCSKNMIWLWILIVMILMFVFIPVEAMCSFSPELYFSADQRWN